MTIASTGLIARLACTERLVRRLDEEGTFVESITAEQAVQLARRVPYTGSCRGHHGQVRSIRPVATKRQRPIEDAYPGMAVLWTIGYRRGIAA